MFPPTHNLGQSWCLAINYILENRIPLYISEYPRHAAVVSLTDVHNGLPLYLWHCLDGLSTRTPAVWPPYNRRGHELSWEGIWVGCWRKMKGTEENAGVRRGYTGVLCERVQGDMGCTWNGNWCNWACIIPWALYCVMDERWMNTMIPKLHGHSFRPYATPCTLKTTAWLQTGVLVSIHWYEKALWHELFSNSCTEIPFVKRKIHLPVGCCKLSQSSKKTVKYNKYVDSQLQPEIC